MTRERGFPDREAGTHEAAARAAPTIRGVRSSGTPSWRGCVAVLAARRIREGRAAARAAPTNRGARPRLGGAVKTTRSLSILQVLEKGLFSTGSVVQMFQLARGLAGRGHRVAIVSRPEGDVPARARARARLHRASTQARVRLRQRAAAGERSSTSAPWTSSTRTRVSPTRSRSSRRCSRGGARSSSSTAASPFRSTPSTGSSTTCAWTRVVTVCEDIKKVIVASGRLSPKVNVIYAGVDLARFDPAKAGHGARAPGVGRPAGETLLVQVGAREWKGWRT